MEIELTNKAVKQYECLSEPELSRITAAINGLELEPPVGNIVKLTDKEGEYRLRTGNYRIIYKKTDDCIVITKIAQRGQAYKE